MIGSRKLLAVLAALSMVSALWVGVASPVSAGPTAFTDTQGVWGESDILKLQSAKAVGGFSDNSFRPEAQVTRAEFATILARAKGWPVPAAIRTDYKDINPQKWYATYVNAAVQQNALIGDGAQFRPEASITLGEVVAAAVRARFTDEEISAVQSPGIYLAQFADVGDTPAWSRKYLAMAIKNGIYPFRLAKDKLRAVAPATRSEVAVVIARAIKSSEEFGAGSGVEGKGAEKVDARPYTGLIVDARGLKLWRSMSPRLVNAFAATVWDSGVRDIKVFNANTYYGYVDKLSDEEKDYVLERGIVSYAKDPAEACVRSRSGDNPLIVRGIRAAHSSQDWVVISREDAKAIQAADKVSGFLKEFKVSILLEK